MKLELETSSITHNFSTFLGRFTLLLFVGVGCHNIAYATDYSERINLAACGVSLPVLADEYMLLARWRTPITAEGDMKEEGWQTEDSEKSEEENDLIRHICNGVDGPCSAG